MGKLKCPGLKGIIICNSYWLLDVCLQSSMYSEDAERFHFELTIPGVLSFKWKAIGKNNLLIPSQKGKCAIHWIMCEVTKFMLKLRERKYISSFLSCWFFLCKKIDEKWIMGETVMDRLWKLIIHLEKHVKCADKLYPFI